MRFITCLLILFFTEIVAFAQQDAFNYSVSLVPININNLQGLHSYAVAQDNGKWLIIGGRTDGIHARQPFNAFPQTSNNTNIYVIDVATNQFWTSSITTLPTALAEQLQSTNMNFYQDADTLYFLGGYAYSPTAVDHITFPYLTSVSVSGLINAVINGSSISPYFKQISDSIFAVTGGHLNKIGNTFYLVGGQRFDGRYNPMGGPTYTQTYVDGIRKFSINNSGTQLSYSNYTTITDAVHLHRRDYNLVPQIFPDGSQGLTISSGVFQIGVDLPFLYPVDISSSGYTPITSFIQYLSNYHSATACIYDSVNNQMHSLFFGGMSQYYYQNNVLMQDNNVPFVKTISRVTRYSDSTLLEHLLPIEMPSLIGASAEFIPNQSLPHYPSEILKLSAISSDSIMIGHIYGGIYSPTANPFTANNTSTTSASNVIYEVWLIRDTTTATQIIDGYNPLSITVFPNPSNGNVKAEMNLPYDGNLDLFVTDITGNLILENQFKNLKQGMNTLKVVDKNKLSPGIYFLNFTFANRYSHVNKIIITD